MPSTLPRLRYLLQWPEQITQSVKGQGEPILTTCGEWEQQDVLTDRIQRVRETDRQCD